MKIPIALILLLLFHTIICSKTIVNQPLAIWSVVNNYYPPAGIGYSVFSITPNSIIIDNYVDIYTDIIGPSTVTAQLFNGITGEKIYNMSIANPSNFVFLIPSDTFAGVYYMYLDIDPSLYTQTFYVLPSVGVNPSTTYSGSTVEIIGKGFSPNSDIIINFNEDFIYQINTNSEGSFTYNYTIPQELTQGIYEITAEDKSLNPLYNTGQTNIIINPEFIINPTNGPLGTVVTFSGNGFTPSQYLNIILNNTIIKTININYSKLFSDIQYIIPIGTPIGTNIFSAEQSFVFFNVIESTIIITPNQGIPESPVLIEGQNFLPNSYITISFNGSNISNSITNSQGIFTETLIIPQHINPGTYQITATDGYNIAINNFIITELLTINPNFGPIGSEIEVSGYGFAKNSNITISLFLSDNNIYTATTIPSQIITNDLGLFTGQVQISNELPSFQGNLFIQAKDDLGNIIENIFNVIYPIMVITPNNGTIGTIVAINGNGFIPNSNISITFEDYIV